MTHTYTFLYQLVWDILNMLAFYQDKQPALIVRSFRSAQAQLQFQWLNIFFEPLAGSGKSKSYRLRSNSSLPDCSLSANEWRTRMELLMDRCTQFFTAGNSFEAEEGKGGKYVASSQELALFEMLVSYGISNNQRCNNFIAWGLHPKNPRDLRAYIVDALWMRTRQDEFQSGIICDGKRIKAFLWISLMEDIVPPIENLQPLCQALNIRENDFAWNLEHELDRLDLTRTNLAGKQKQLLDKTLYKFEPLVQHCIETSMVTTRRVAELQVLSIYIRIVLLHLTCSFLFRMPNASCSCAT